MPGKSAVSMDVSTDVETRDIMMIPNVGMVEKCFAAVPSVVLA